MSELLHISGTQMFQEEVVNYKWVVLMDFYADWCWPCRMLWPIMEELHNSYIWKTVKIVKVDVDAPWNQSIAMEFWVSSIPAVFVVKNWEIIEGVIWVNPKSVYEQKINALLG